jgi:RNA polymerase sigma-70 factor (ECF subfamily)
LTAEQVFGEHATRIYKVARRMLDPTDAEDVTQEVLVQVVRKLDTFRHEADVTTWLHRVTVNAALAHRRKSARRCERQLSEPMEHILTNSDCRAAPRPTTSGPEQHVLDQEVRALIESAIAALPPLYRDVYVLADLEGLANAEIAAVLGLNVPTVKSRLHRARLLLRTLLAPHFAELLVA